MRIGDSLYAGVKVYGVVGRRGYSLEAVAIGSFTKKAEP
jgi:hypothetical protein